MGPRSGVLTYEVTNAVLGWFLIVVLVVAGAFHARAGDFLWTGMAAVTVIVALVPPVVGGRPTEMIAWEVLGFATVPVVVTLFGVFGETVTFLPVPALALVVAVELDAFTAVEMTTEFAVAFVVILTMALAGLAVVVSYASDVYFDTSLLTSQTAVMWDLVIATGIGVVAGVVFELYFRRFSLGHNLSRETWGELG